MAAKTPKDPSKQSTVTTSRPQAGRNRQTVTFDVRWIIGGLLAMIVIMLLSWQPWRESAVAPANKDRTIRVTGEASLQATPDQFVFYPSYTVQNADRPAALAEISKRSENIISKLKELGVEDNEIKSSASGYDQPEYAIAPKPGFDSTTYSLTLTITVTDKALAQKVQDYLATTSPTGAVTPSSDFSANRRRQLEAKARDDATKDARSKANQSARNLGFRLGSVKSVVDGNGFSGVTPFAERGVTTDAAAPSVAPAPKLNVQPGENELRYTVTVEYYVK